MLERAVFFSGAALVVTGVAMSFVGATPVLGQTTSCDSSGSPVAVHYQIAVGSFPGITTGAAVSAVVLSAFPAECEGTTVKLEMLGNSAGNPSLPFSDDHLLSTADSTLDPCSQNALAAPLVVTHGSITLPLCATGGAAGYASVHDLTALALFLPASASGVLGASTSGTGSAVPIPVTGSPFSLAADLIAMGIALLIAGAIVFARSPRRLNGTD
ncbi:MAG: hypothetical protein WBA31_07185 [Candidatus Dormiibacterota bacterium]